jgi:hypothetical protein
MKREKDSQGFEFDGYDIDLSRSASHYAEMLMCPRSYNWVNSEGERVDLRKADINYLSNILDWSVIHDCPGTPYMSLPVFKYAQKRYKKLAERKRAVIQKIMESAI